jgi:hypothetical protein
VTYGEENKSLESAIYFSDIQLGSDPLVWYETLNLGRTSPSELDFWLKEAESELKEWATHALQKNIPSYDLTSLVGTMEEQNRQWLYQTVDGSVLFDSQGDPLLRSIDPETTQLEKMEWEQTVLSVQNLILQNWSMEAESVSQQIQHSLPEEFRDSVKNHLQVSLDQYRRRIRAETDRLITWSSRSFDSIRRDDLYSLRNKSEEDTAESLAEQLIQEARFSLHETDQILEEGIDDLKNAVVQDAEFSIENWDQSFQDEFYKGLERWNQAEEEFITERLNWELRVETGYQEAEQNWDKALVLFSQKRKEWIQDVTDLLDEGQQEWLDQEDRFVEQFQNIAQEIEQAAAEQEYKFSEQVQSALEVYRENLYLLDRAEENTLFYQNKIDQLEGSISSLASDIMALEGEKMSLSNQIQRFQNMIDEESLSNEDGSFNSKSGLWNFLILIQQKAMKPLDARLDSLNAQWTALSSEKNHFENEKKNWESLEVSIGDQLNSSLNMLLTLEEQVREYDSSVPIDTLDIEIQRMKVQRDSLYQQYLISEAVVDYADLDSSARATEAQTLESFQEAERALADMEQLYSEATSTLSELSLSLGDGQEELMEARRVMDEALSLMVEAQNTYETSFAVYQNNNPAVIEQMMEDIEDELFSWYEGSEGLPGAKEEMYDQYIQAGEWEHLESLRAMKQDLLLDLLGAEVEGQAGIYRNIHLLEEESVSLNGLYPDFLQDDLAAWQLKMEEAGFHPASEEYVQLSGYYEQALSLSESDSKKAALSLLLSLQQIRNQAQSDLLWSQSLLSFLEIPEQDVFNLESRRMTLEENLADAENAFYWEKGALLYQILSSYEDDQSNSEPWFEYAAFLKSLSFNTAPLDLEALADLTGLLDQVRTGSMSREDVLSILEDGALFWLKLLTDEIDDIPGMEYLDLYLSEPLLSITEAQAELDAWGQAVSLFPSWSKEMLTSQFQQDFTTGSQFVQNLIQMEDLDSLLDCYYPLIQGDSLPDYLTQGFNRLIKVFYSEDLDQMRPDSSVFYGEMIRLQDVLASFGETDFQREAFFSSQECMEIYGQEGFTEQLEELHRYESLLRWKNYESDQWNRAWEKAFETSVETSLDLIEPELDRDLLFSDFIREEGSLSVSREELEALDYASKEYPLLTEYTSWSGNTARDFLEEVYPEAGFLEEQYLLLIMQNPHDSSLESLKRQWAWSLFEEMSLSLETNRSEYYKAQFLERLWEIEPEDSNIVRNTEFVQVHAAECLDTFFSGLSEGPLEGSVSLLREIQGIQLLMENKQIMLEKLEEDLSISRQNSMQYKTNIVDRDFQIYEEQKMQFDTALAAYERISEHFDSLQKDYLAGQDFLEQTIEDHSRATVQYQQAKEILDYAQTGYSPGVINVYSIRDKRFSEYEKARAALEVLENISENQNPVSDLDGDWTESLDSGNQILSLMNNLSYTRDELSSEMGELNREYGNVLNDMTGTAQQLIDFSFRDEAGFSFDSSQTESTMTDFSTWKNSSLQTHIDQYFDQPDVSEIFTKDVLLWMKALGSQGNLEGIFKKFSFAFYNELRSIQGMSWDKIKRDYSIDLFTNPQHEALLDIDGTMFTSVSIGYEGNIEKFKAGGYEVVTDQFFNLNGECFKVFISGEEWLREQTESARRGVLSNGNLKNLYSFYKVLMYSGAFKSDSLKKAMEKDLSAIAWDYIDDVANSQQQKFKRVIFSGYRSKGEEIRDVRDTIQSSAYAFNGISLRNSIASSVETVESHLGTLKHCANRMTELFGSEDCTAASLKSLTYSVSGISLDSSQTELLMSSFSSMSSLYKGSNSMALDGLLQELSILKQQNDQDLYRRELELSSKQDQLYDQLISTYGQASFNIEEYESIARSLYLRPAYFSEDYRDRTFASIWTADHPSSRDSLYTLMAYGDELIRGFQNRMTLVRQDRYNEFQKGLESIYAQKTYWEERTQDLIQEGLDQWNLSTRKLIGQRESWRSSYEREYQYKVDLWDKKYWLMTDNKNSWLKNSSEAAVTSGTIALANNLGLDAEQLIGDVRFTLIPDIQTDPVDLSELVESSLEGMTLDRLLTGMKNLASRNIENNVIFSSRIPSLPDTHRSMDRLKDQQTELKEQINKALSMTQASQLSEAVDAARKSVSENIDQANRSIDENLESQFNDAGYARQGRHFTRVAIIDTSLLGGSETETHSFEGYRYFIAPEFDTQINLSADHLKNMNSDMVRASVTLAQERLLKYMNLIFGNETDEDDKPVDLRTGLDQDFIQYLEEQERIFHGSAQSGSDKYDETKGLFNFHVGYAPLMDEDSPEDVKTRGFGEFGRIYEQFMIQQARLFRGLSTLKTPWYSRKIWDDDADNDGDSDGLIGAPSVRTVSDIALTVAGTALGMGPFPAMMLGMVDDALFTVADMSLGVMSSDEALGGFAKKAGSSLLSLGTGALGSSLDSMTSLSHVSGLGEVVSDVGIAGFSTTVNSFGNAAIQSLDGDGFNVDRFNSMINPDSMKVNYISALAGTGVSSTLELGTFGFINDAKDNTDALTRLSGGLTSSGIEYAMTGQTKLNIAKLLGAGVLELNLGGGTLLNMGTGGTDVSSGTLSQASNGLKDYAQNRKIREAGVDRILRAAMRTIYSANMDETDALYDDILNKKAILSTGRDQEYEGVSSQNDSGQRLIDLNLDGKNSLDLGVLLTHEAFRDGVDNGKDNQVMETRNAVLGHMSVSAALSRTYGDRSLNITNQNEAKMFMEAVKNQDPNSLMSYVDGEYESTGDYWKRLDDGTIVRDGKAGLYDEDGNLIRLAVDENGAQFSELESLKYYTDPTMNAYLSGMTSKQMDTFVENSSFQSSDDVNKQVEMRDSIISDYNQFKAWKYTGAISDSDYQTSMEYLYRCMGNYNLAYMETGIGTMPEGVITQQLHTDKTIIDIEGPQLMDYAHPGIDKDNGIGVFSPGFSEVIPGADRNHGVLMRMLGTDYAYRELHLNPDDVKNIDTGRLLFPGEMYANSPEDLNGTGTGAHTHGELIWNHPEYGPGFTNPVNRQGWYSGWDFPVSKYDPIYDENAQFQYWNFNSEESSDYWKPRGF